MKKARYYIGVMSGTSADGVDIALVDFSDKEPQCSAHYYRAFSIKLQQNIISLYSPSSNEIDVSGSLGVELAVFFADAIHSLLKQEQLLPEDIIAIGCHGQTIRHRPVMTEQIPHPFTLQIGCHQTLACLTSIRVIGDFRTKDIALGGQGAPLVPAFHHYLFKQREQDTFIINLGGIANITYLPQDSKSNIIGFDTGPANTLLDMWCFKCTGKAFDENGDWASQGTVNTQVLEALLSDPYFTLPCPKSTGREYFNLAWLAKYLSDFTCSACDVQATLLALTVTTIVTEVNKLSPKGFVYLSGGGIDNNACYKHLKQSLNTYTVDSINSLNLNNNAFEAMAFAWLAFAYDKKIYGNIPSVTGASASAVLGVEYSP